MFWFCPPFEFWVDPRRAARLFLCHWAVNCAAVQYLLIVAGTECDPSVLSAWVINPAAIVRSAFVGVEKLSKSSNSGVVGVGVAPTPKRVANEPTKGYRVTATDLSAAVLQKIRVKLL